MNHRAISILLIGMRAHGKPAVLQGRGAYHGVPEVPIGLSLTSLAPGSEGKTIWRYEPNRSKACYTMHWNSKYAAWFDIDASEHQVLDAGTGKLLRTQSLVSKVDWRRFNTATGKYDLLADTDLSKHNPNHGPALLLMNNGTMTELSLQDVAFHDRIIQATRHRPLAACWKTIRSQIEVWLARAHRAQAAAHLSSIELTVPGHRRLLAALCSGSEREAEEAMRIEMATWREWLPA